MRSSKSALLGLLLVAACSRVSDDVRLVIDNAELLDAEQRMRIATFHSLLLQDYAIDYRVVTTADTGDIDRYAAAQYAALDAGAASDRGHGLLLVIDPAEDRVRLEVGYALEGSFPDAFIAYVEQRQMVPFFAAGRVADGILATTELIVNRADAALANAGLESEIALAGSGGAGAATAARLGAGQTGRHSGGAVEAGNSPDATLAKYLAAMRERNANPELEIYTPATRQMLRNWVMTPGQMDNLVSTYRACHAESARVDASSSYAVIRYPVAERRCAPWFFERSGRVWALDLTMMQRAIRFGRDNSWHFERGAEHPYEFAFADWQLDAHGYPHAR